MKVSLESGGKYLNLDWGGGRYKLLDHREIRELIDFLSLNFMVSPIMWLQIMGGVPYLKKQAKSYEGMAEALSYKERRM